MFSQAGTIVVYSISLIISMFVLYFVKWDKVMVKENRSIAILLYVLCSIALAFLVGSFILKIISPSA